jgi:hypothetical protein
MRDIRLQVCNAGQFQRNRINTLPLNFSLSISLMRFTLWMVDDIKYKLIIEGKFNDRG